MVHGHMAPVLTVLVGLAGGLVVATSPEFAKAATGDSPDVWVAATRSMLACTAVNDDPSLADLVLETLIHPRADGSLPDACYRMEPGDVFKLEDGQTAAETEIFVKLWSPVCSSGCLPSMVPVYAPPRRLVGAYLRVLPDAPDW